MLLEDTCPLGTFLDAVKPGWVLCQAHRGERGDVRGEKGLADFAALSCIETGFLQSQGFQGRVPSDDLFDHAEYSLSRLMRGVTYSLDT